MITGQMGDKPTRGQSSRGLFISRTSQLADSKFLLNHGQIIIYLYTKQNYKNLILNLTL